MKWKSFIIVVVVLYFFGATIYLAATHSRYDVPAYRVGQSFANPKTRDSWDESVAAELNTVSVDFSTWDQISTFRLPEGGFEATAPSLRLVRPQPSRMISADESRHFPYFDRVIYDLDLTDHFPRHNRGIKNLMKVEIPSIQLNSRRELFEMIAKTAQVTQDPALGFLPTKDLAFPIRLEQTSPAKLIKLLESHCSHCTSDAVPVIDEERLSLTVAKRQPTWFQKMGNWLESVVPW